MIAKELVHIFRYGEKNLCLVEENHNGRMAVLKELCLVRTVVSLQNTQLNALMDLGTTINNFSLSIVKPVLLSCKNKN